MAIVNGTVTIDYQLCSTCTQCIAVFKQRRTVRKFKADKIEPKLLEEIVGYGAYAPSHNFNFRTIVVVDDDLIDLSDAVVLRFCRSLYRFMFKSRLLHTLIRSIAPAWEPELRRARPKLEKALRTGSGLGSPPAAILFIAGGMSVCSPLSGWVIQR